MKQYPLIALVILGAIAILAPTMQQPTGATLRIGIVAVPGDYDGTGCRFQLRSDYDKRNERYVFVVNAEEQGILSLDSADVWLPRARFDAGTDNSLSRFVDHYRKDELEVRADLVVTKKCHPSDENCEATLFNTVLTVKRGAAQRTIRARGFCGM